MHAPDHPSSGDVPQRAAALVERLRRDAPRVHCLTNTVAQNFTANVLLAAGCVPSMTISPEEIAAFVTGADALLINLGTFDAERREAAAIAVKAAAAAHKPWVLDPVLIDRAPLRAGLARELLASQPAVVRLNPGEFATLAGADAGVDALRDFATRARLVVALSGERDLVVDDRRLATLANGHALMAKVTAMGCAASALIAACLAVERDPWLAAASGLSLLGVAGEQAARHAQGPGSFAVAIVDALHALDATTVTRHARVS